MYVARGVRGTSGKRPVQQRAEFLCNGKLTVDKRTALAAIGMNDRLRLAFEANTADSIHHAIEAGATWAEIGEQLDGGLTAEGARGWVARFDKRVAKQQTHRGGR